MSFPASLSSTFLRVEAKEASASSVQGSDLSCLTWRSHHSLTLGSSGTRNPAPPQTMRDGLAQKSMPIGNVPLTPADAALAEGCSRQECREVQQSRSLPREDGRHLLVLQHVAEEPSRTASASLTLHIVSRCSIMQWWWWICGIITYVSATVSRCSRA